MIQRTKCQVDCLGPNCVCFSVCSELVSSWANAHSPKRLIDVLKFATVKQEFWKELGKPQYDVASLICL
ncbi:hypothetical protein ACLKA6_016715 [Drosophila palustris]